MNCDGAPNTITLKYFTPGHSFMSADHFHHHVENKMKLKDKIYDFNDFVDCISTVGLVMLMTHSDFKNFEKELLNDKDFKEVFFLQQKNQRSFKNKCKEYTGREGDRGINPEKRKNIKELFDLIPANRREFYNSLKTNEHAVYLIDSN